MGQDVGYDCHDVPERGFDEGAFAERDAAVLEEQAQFVAVVDGVVEELLQVFLVDVGQDVHQVLGEVVRILRDLVGDGDRVEAGDVEDVE